MAEPNEFEKAREAFLDTLKRMGMSGGAPEPQPQSETADTEDSPEERRRRALRFDLKPKEVKAYLDRFIVQQEDAKRVLATAVCDHYNFVRMSAQGADAGDNYVKHNVIMLGPTGVGKTYLVRKLADLVGVPFAKADATKFSETGYAGGDVDDVVRELVQKAGGDVALAQCGIVYLDEIDKIAAASERLTRDVSGSGVQRGLLKLMEESEVPVRNPQDLQSQLQGMLEFQQKGRISHQSVNTRHILFIVSGAFSGLETIIESRLRSGSVGFTAQLRAEREGGDLLRAVNSEDLVRYGFEPEFVGRLPVRVICDPLSEEDLFQVLTSSEGSILRQYRAAFDAYGIRLEVDDEAVREIAALAARERTGARALATVCERIFRDMKYELPSADVKTVRLTRAMVEQPETAVAAAIEAAEAERSQSIEEQLREFERQFARRHGIDIRFAEDAREVIRERASGEDLPQSWLERTLENFPYGLELIQKRTGQRRFVLPAAALREPRSLLDEWIKSSYASE